MADKTVEQFIRDEIKHNFSCDGFLGEESGYSGLESQFCWIVDPIDGTSPFLHGLHAWCISISIIDKGELFAGLIFDPLHDELFHCLKGRGAYLNDDVMNTIQSAETLQDGLVGAGMSHRGGPKDMSKFIENLLINKGMFVRNGSGALTLAQVAAGRLIGYYEPHMNIWDCAAGTLLVIEAGGYSKDVLENDGLHRGSLVLATANKKFMTFYTSLFMKLIGRIEYVNFSIFQSIPSNTRKKLQ
ncbi:inositol monophosphatase family protein [Spirabiliibacterium mucosae]|uniref:inositol monophosphatase family protein n=1 Tax=Spirabiliibacterium mucosae TaxID=28156 RepID=UPI001F45BBDF|nr:inositol monophosphatase [Spirabiliibacterium mucosae]